jgi:hypothetical protein
LTLLKVVKEVAEFRAKLSQVIFGYFFVYFLVIFIKAMPDFPMSI